LPERLHGGVEAAEADCIEAEIGADEQAVKGFHILQRDEFCVAGKVEACRREAWDEAQFEAVGQG
jgi:hypothetical protein